MVEDVISYISAVVGALIEMFYQLLVATETLDLWVAGVCFALFISIVAIPFRGGNAIGGGGFVGFITNRVNNHKTKKSNKVSDHGE